MLYLALSYTFMLNAVFEEYRARICLRKEDNIAVIGVKQNAADWSSPIPIILLRNIQTKLLSSPFFTFIIDDKEI
jgi:hypothetical protein